MGIANLVAAHKPTENAKLEDQIQPPFCRRLMRVQCPPCVRPSIKT